MSLLEQMKLALTSLIERTLLSWMGLPGKTELVLKNLKIDLWTHFTVGLSGLPTELRTDTLQSNMGKFSCCKLKRLIQFHWYYWH